MAKRNARFESLKSQAQRLAEMVLCAGPYLRNASKYGSAQEMAAHVLADLEQEAAAVLEGMAESGPAQAAPEAKPRRTRKPARRVDSKGAAPLAEAPAHVE